MKKTLLKAFGVLTLAVTMVLASCSTDASNISSQIDTVLTLQAPVVKVTAYPGMNYVSWKPVANANSYKVFIYEDDHFIHTESLSGVSSLKYKDTDIKNGARYTYIVEAESKSSTGRSVVTENAKSSEVSVTAIVPDYNVKSLELNNHEKGINSKGNEKFVIAADNIHVARDGFDKFSISFPSKAYLNYDVSYSIDNEKATVDKFAGTVVTSALKDNASNDKILYTKGTPTLTSGVYTIAVKANAENAHFGTSDWVISAETITVENLIGSFASSYTIYAKYKDLGKTVRVVFPKFTLNSGATADASYYKVYRSTQEAPHNYTAVSGTVKATDATNANFYVEDTIEDNTIGYYYTIAVTDGKGKFASTSQKSALVDPYTATKQTATTVSGAPSTQETDATANDITWTITLPSADVKIKGIYTLERPATDSYNTGTSTSPDTKYQVVAADFDTAAEKNLLATAKSTTNDTGKVFTVYTKNHTVGTKVYMLVVTEQEDKAIAEAISVAVEIKAPVVSDANLTIDVTKYDNTINGANSSTTTVKKDDVIINVEDTIDTDTDAIGNYTYKLYRANVKYNTTTTSYYWEFDATDWVEVSGFTMKPKAEVLDGKYIGIIEQENLADGIYAYKVIKSNATSSVIKIDYVTIENKTTIDFKPGDDGWGTLGFVTPTAAESNVKIEFYKGKLDSVTPLTPIYGDSGDLDGRIIAYQETTEESGVTYSLYRARLGASYYTDENTNDLNYRLEFKKVTQADGVTAKGFGKTDHTVPKDVYYMNAGSLDTHSVDFVDRITYSIDDTGLSTGDSYMYIIVATKTGAEPVIVENIFVKGKN